MAKIAFIFSQFPCIDEVFLLREFVHLEKTGLDFIFFSMKTSKDKVIQPDAQKLLPKTVNLPFFSGFVLWANLVFLFSRPGRYITAFLSVFFGNLKSFDFWWKSLVFWPKIIGFAYVARERDVTQVHGNWATHPATAAFVISRLLDIPYSFTGHAHDIYLDTTMLAFKIKHSKFVTTCTETNLIFLQKIAGERKGKIIPNYHGVDLERFEGEKIPREKFTILSVGTLVDRKGFEYLIQACDILRKRGFDFECIIAGGGPEEAKLRKLIKDLDLGDRVNMMGRVTQNEIIPLYKKADVFALTVKTKDHFGIPNVFIEALASKLVPISTRLESIHELIRDGETGLIVPDEDAKATADAIEKLYREPVLRASMAERGYQIVKEKFDAGKNVKALKELFEE